LFGKKSLLWGIEQNITCQIRDFLTETRNQDGTTDKKYFNSLENPILENHKFGHKQISIGEF